MKKMKNPRKYVERLKKDLAWWKKTSSENSEEWMKAIGKYWFFWKPVFHVPVEISKTIPVDGLHPGDEVIMVGKITEIHQTPEGNSAVMEFTEVRVRK